MVHSFFCAEFEPRALCIPGKHFILEPHPRHVCVFALCCIAHLPMWVHVGVHNLFIIYLSIYFGVLGTEPRAYIFKASICHWALVSTEDARCDWPSLHLCLLQPMYREMVQSCPVINYLSCFWESICIHSFRPTFREETFLEVGSVDPKKCTF